MDHRGALKIMNSNITDQQYLATDLQLSEPRFDEEATVLSARPVVPLYDVKTEARSGKRLVFGLAIVCAVLAGAFGGSLIYRQREQKQSAAVAHTDTPQPVISRDETLSGAAGMVSDDSRSSPLAVSENGDNGDNIASREAHKGGTTRNNGKSAPVLSDDSGGVNEALKDRAESQSDERELRRAERKEARRLIRDAEREGIREARGHRASEDLLKIREIFEGVRRP